MDTGAAIHPYGGVWQHRLHVPAQAPRHGRTAQMTDLDGTHREIGSRSIDAGEARTILVRRRYTAPVGDVWRWCTEAELLGRWFMRPEGDLRLGGRFTFEGNAGGEIRRCEPPRLLAVTWVYGDRPADEVWLRLTEHSPGATLLELEHASVTTEIEVNGRMVDVLLNDPGSGLWGLGAGWEMGLVALDALLRHDAPDPATVRPTSRAQARSLADQSSQAWAALLAAR
jgi:uncharacterized protein YndB with AHSA1/START domain